MKFITFFRRWVQRAYEAAQDTEDRQKIQDYIQKRMRPLLDAGTVNAVAWDREPLPHERNYVVPGGMWTPAAEIRAKFSNATPTKQGGQRPRGNSNSLKRSPSPRSDSTAKRNRGGSSSESVTEIQVEEGLFIQQFLTIQVLHNSRTSSGFAVWTSHEED